MDHFQCPGPASSGTKSMVSKLSDLIHSYILHLTATTEVHSDDTEAEVDSGENAAVLKGLLQCMLGIAGLAIFLWILFFFIAPPCA